MHVLIANLHKDRAAVGEQVAGHGQAVAEIAEVGVDAVPPGVAEGLDLLRLAGDVLGLAVLDVAAGGGPLEVGVELDAVGRVEVDALHAASEPLALGQGGHDRKRVAEDHAVGPVLVVPVELGAVHARGHAVEGGEQVDLTRLAGEGLLAQVIDEHLGVDLLLDVERRRRHHQVGPVLQVLAPPDQLRVEVAVAALVGHLDRVQLAFRHHRLMLGRGDVSAGGLLVDEGGDGQRGLFFACHGLWVSRVSAECWPRAGRASASYLDRYW